MRKLTLSLILILLVFSVATASAQDGSVNRSIVVVFDLSYSMTTIENDTGLSRYTLGIAALERVFEKSTGEEEWSLVVCEDAESTFTVGDFTTDPDIFIPMLKEQEPWGRTSVDTMVLAGFRRFSSAAEGSDKFLVLITDGIHTTGSLYDLRRFDVRGDPVVPIVLGFRIDEYEELVYRVSDWITGSGGTFLYHDQSNELGRILAGGAATAGTETGDETADRESPAEQVGPLSRRPESATAPVTARATVLTTAYVPIWWIFLIPAAGFTGAAAYLFYRWREKRRILTANIGQPRQVVTIACSVHDGEIERHTFDRFPVKVSGRGKPDLMLDKPKISSGARSFSIIKKEDGFEFSASGPFVINGVGRKTHELGAGDRIHFGRYRIVFEGVSYNTPPPPELPRPQFLLFLPVITAFLILMIVFREPVETTRKRTVETTQTTAGISTAPGTRVPQMIDHERSSDRAAKAPVRGGAPSTVSAAATVSAAGATDTAAADSTVGGATETATAATEDGAAVAAKAGSTADGRPDVSTVVFRTELEEIEVDGFPTVVWEPGVEPDFFKVDALFFHAHPDDETLDFGVLLRRLADSGKRTAVVLFTDGNAGLDQYPWRQVGAGYPAYDLTGNDLAEVRVEEAQSAMSLLGVNHYVRLGLKNNPYGGIADELSTDSVVAAWGGEEELVERIASLILGYRPEIIVSTEPPSDALEHFEHETVGYLVDAALKKLEREDTFEPAGRLVSIDPLQKGLYPKAVGIESEAAGNGISYRRIQAAALAEYHTQRDASVVGVENLSGFDREYYRFVRWNLPQTIEEYLAPR